MGGAPGTVDHGRVVGAAGIAGEGGDPVEQIADDAVDLLGFTAANTGDAEVETWVAIAESLVEVSPDEFEEFTPERLITEASSTSRP